MNSSFTIKIIFFAIIVIIFQILIPVININGLEMTPDILIIFLAYLGYYYGRWETIIMGFFLGLIQDLATQYELIGIMAFVKSLSGYGLGTMALYRNIWSVKSRMLFIFLMYFLHFLIFYFIKFNGAPIPVSISIQIVIIHSLLSYLILFIIEKSFIRHGVTAE